MALVMGVVLTRRQEGQVERHLWGRCCGPLTWRQAGTAAGDTSFMCNGLSRIVQMPGCICL